MRDTTAATHAAETLCALWTCGTQVSIPFDKGLLDRSLENSLSLLPSSLSSMLTFEDGPDGRRCVQLPEIEAAGRESGIFGSHPMAPGSGTITMGRPEAEALLMAQGMDVDASRLAGRALFDEVVRRTSRGNDDRADVQDAALSNFGV
jgi:hypothetical protein